MEGREGFSEGIVKLRPKMSQVGQPRWKEVLQAKASEFRTRVWRVMPGKAASGKGDRYLFPFGI